MDGTNITEYTFDSWDESRWNIRKPTEFRPEFDYEKFKGYKVTFVDSKNPNANYSYYYEEKHWAWNPYANYWGYDDKEVTVFVGWDKDVSSVTQEMTVNAVYKTIPINQNGEYPQDKVTNEVLISALNSINETDNHGYYEYQGERYAKKDGLFFEVSPIRWRYLSENEGNSMFVSEYILDERVWNATEHEEGIYMNNYKYSDIRKWLNNEFLKNAFSDESLIETTAVDNSVVSIGHTNPYGCETTNDKVFLLSLTESRGYYCNRVAYKTDYAAGGEGGQVRSRSWYLRTPREDSEDNGDCVYFILSDGDLDDIIVNYCTNGIRPALTLKI